jgi:hypothetical protein
MKKKKTTDKEDKPKGKSKRERSDYKELLSPEGDEEKRVVPSSNTKTTSEEKPKKKKSKEKKSSEPPVFDMMTDDNSSNQQYNEQNIYKLTAESDNLTIVRTKPHLLTL